jgi:hypothetical protein
MGNLAHVDKPNTGYICCVSNKKTELLAMVPRRRK